LQPGQLASQKNAQAQAMAYLRLCLCPLELWPVRFKIAPAKFYPAHRVADDCTTSVAKGQSRAGFGYSLSTASCVVAHAAS
jgi:hypothetical protein